MSQPHILMCPPDFYGIEYEINPWMNRARQADHALAVTQWKDLHRILQGAGATVSTLTPVERLPDQQKEVVILKIWGELTFDEIARTLDESLNTVASRYRYALQKLKNLVPEEMEGKKEGLTQ